MKTGETRMMRRANGFSLVELLVGIAIVAILAALIVPAVSKAMEKSQRGGSVVALKSILAASGVYQAEHNGNLPPYESSEWGGSRFSGLPYKYISEFLPEIYGEENYKMFVRPGDKLFIDGDSSKAKRIQGGVSPWSYARNIALPQRSGMARIDNSVSPMRLEKPSGTILFFETLKNGAIGVAQIPQIYFDGEGLKGKSVVGMADGHVEMLTRAQLVGTNGASPGAWTPEQKLLWFGYSTVAARTDY